MKEKKAKGKKPEKTATQIKTEATMPDGFFDFLRRGKSTREICEKFGISEEQVKGFLAKPPADGEIYQDKTHGEVRVLFIPKSKKVEIEKRIWSYVPAVNGGAAVDIIFPDDIGWRRERSDVKDEKKLEKMRIVPIADIWFGHKLHDAATFDERIAWIAREPHVFWFFNGDAIFPPTAAEIKAGKDLELHYELKRKLMPIAHKWLWAQSGCFEDKTSGSSSFDPMEWMCSQWDVPYFRTPVSTGIHWAGNLFEFYCLHGKSQAQKKGTKLNAVLRILGEIEFRHFIVMSHIKDAIVSKPTRVVTDQRKFDLREQKQYAFITPSFVTYDGSREAKWGYPLPFRGQVNCALYKDGDYHLFSSSLPTDLVKLERGR